MGQRTRTTWTKGQGGKPKGAKDRFPRGAKRAVEMLLDRFGTNLPLLTQVLQRGLEARPPTSFPYLRMIVEQQLGAPDQPVSLKHRVILAPRD